MMDELEVNHKDLDTTNNKMSNLEWVTEKENKDHYIASDKFKAVKRDMVCGEEQHLSKLTEEQVLEIRAISTEGKYGSVKEVYEFYGISRSAHRDIVKGRTWKHLLPTE
jgi:hypothetical protein